MRSSERQHPCIGVTFGASRSISSNSPYRPILATQSNWLAENTETQFAKFSAKSQILLVARGRPILESDYFVTRQNSTPLFCL